MANIPSCYDLEAMYTLRQSTSSCVRITTTTTTTTTTNLSMTFYEDNLATNLCIWYHILQFHMPNCSCLPASTFNSAIVSISWRFSHKSSTHLFDIRLSCHDLLQSELDLGKVCRQCKQRWVELFLFRLETRQALHVIRLTQPSVYHTRNFLISPASQMSPAPTNWLDILGDLKSLHHKLVMIPRHWVWTIND